jgi:acetyl-CoA carboxylase carboxyl transferase subunit alpha
LGGAHREPQEVADHLKAALLKYFKKATAMGPKELVDARYKKYRSIGEFIEK